MPGPHLDAQVLARFVKGWVSRDTAHNVGLDYALVLAVVVAVCLASKHDGLGAA